MMLVVLFSVLIRLVVCVLEFVGGFFFIGLFMFWFGVERLKCRIVNVKIV